MFADVVNSFTLGGKRGRRRRRKRDEPDTDSPTHAASEPRADQQPYGSQGGEQEHLLRDQRREQPRAHPNDPRWSTPQAPAAQPEADTGAASVRSYTWTGGRTKSNYQLEIETLVSTSDSYRPEATPRMEHQTIAELCRRPRSVAEIAALLSAPIGVARVLLADMAELGLIHVHQTTTESGSAPHLLLMERVLSGLRRL